MNRNDATVTVSPIVLVYLILVGAALGVIAGSLVSIANSLQILASPPGH